MKASDECSDFFSLYIYDNNDINKEKMITIIIIIIIKVIIIIIVPVKQRSCFTENVACPLVVQVREKGKGKKEFHERIF